MKPYGENKGSTRGVPKVGHKPGGSYDLSNTEKARMRRQMKKRARQGARVDETKTD